MGKSSAVNEWDTLPVIIPRDYAHGDGGNSDSDETHMHHNDDSMSSDMDHGHDHNMPTMMSQGTIMFMDGFHSALFSSPQASAPPPCLNLFYPSWTLHTPSRFVFAMVAITLMGMFVETCGIWRVKFLRKGRSCRREVRLKRLQALREQQRQQRSVDLHGRQIEFRQQSQLELQRDDCDVIDVSQQVAPSPASAALPPPVSFQPRACPTVIQRRMWLAITPKCLRVMFVNIFCCFSIRTKNDGMRAARKYDIIAACLHALRAWLGYLLMLAVMTYAVEFLVSAVVGMVLGRYYCVEMEEGDIVDVVDVGRGIGGTGTGIGGSASGAVMDDGVWGGGDPCCGIDDNEDDYRDDLNVVVGPSLTEIYEPLLSSSSESNARVTRRLVGCQQTE